MANAKRVTYFSAHLEDKPGSLLKVAQELKSKNIALTGLWAFATTEGQGKLYLVGKNPEKLRNVLKTTGVFDSEGTGFLVSGSDRTGALVNTLEAIAAPGINITMLGAIATGARFGSLIRVDPGEVDATAKALGCK